jgi:hypothetical protein
VVCKWTDSPTMDCPDVCLEALWLQEWQWVLEDCHKRSCWKNSIGVSVPRPCGSDMYVCSKSCRLCLTVVYWLLECNKVPSWIEPANSLQYLWLRVFTALDFTHPSWKVRTMKHANNFNFLFLQLWHILRVWTKWPSLCSKHLW